MSRQASATDASARGSGALRFDAIAGLTAAAVVLPKAMAYATVAGLPVAVGLYTAFVPMVVYALLGSSRVLSVSSTTTLAILAGTQLALAVPDGDPARLATAAATLSALVGVVLTAAALLRLGFVANFISTPVLAGFKAGIGLVIVLDQVPKLLGVHVAKAGFFRDLFGVAQHLPETSLVTLAVAAATLLVLIGMERLWPHSPAPLVAVGGGIAATWLLGLPGLGVSTVGLIPRGFPSLTLPDLALAESLLPGALGIALMSFTETIAAGRAFARPAEPPIRPNRELVATGAANVGGALFGAMPAGGGTSQTAVVRAAGGSSQRASLVTASTAAATMLLLAPVLGLLPHATLAAVVIVYSVGLIQPAEFRAIRSVRTMEFRWALIACLGVLVFGTLRGIVVAIVVSMLGLASQTTHPRVYVIGRKRGADVLRPLSPEHPDDETFDGLLILRPEGRIYFVNAQNVAEQIGALIAEHRPRVVALDLSRVPDLEYSALQMLVEGERNAAERGVAFWLVGLNPGVLEVVRRSGLDQRLGRERMLFNARIAIERYQALQEAGGDAGDACVALGSNLGDREAHLAAALAALCAHAQVRVTGLSALYETDPVGPPPQGPYLNAVVRLRTSLPPRALLELLLEIERSCGRQRGERWAARSLDLDLLFYGSLVIDEPGLHVPHPRLHERAFVLEPLCDVAPGFVHPRLGLTVEALAQRVRDPGAVRRREEELSWPSSQ